MYLDDKMYEKIAYQHYTLKKKKQLFNLSMSLQNCQVRFLVKFLFI